MGYEISDEWKVEPWVHLEQEKQRKVETQEELERDAQSSVIPSRISENGCNDEPLTEVIFCDSISGGANYISNMPRRLSLVRKLADGTEYRAEYTFVTTLP